MRRTLIGLVISVALISSCTKSPPTALTRDEYRVFSSYLQQEYGSIGTRGELLIVNRTFVAKEAFDRYTPNAPCVKASGGLIRLLLDSKRAESTIEPDHINLTVTPNR
jgi:hypothetical protein